MQRFSLRKHLAFSWNGADFRIERLQPNGEALIERTNDGQLTIVTREQLLTDYADGAVLLRPSEVQPDKDVAAFSRPLDELPETVQTEARRRWHYVETMLATSVAASTRETLKLLIGEVAERINDPNPPSRATVFRWYQRYCAHRDTRALLPRFYRRGPRQLKQDPTVLALFCEATEEALKASPLASVPTIHTLVVAKVAEANRRNVGAAQIKPPSERTVYRLMTSYHAYDIAVLRDGKRLAINRFRRVGKAPRSINILERVEIDHTPLDLFLIDERTWLPLGRPTLTVVLDHFSRMPLGYYLSFGNPSVAAVMGALRHALLPKSPVLESLPQLPVHHSWPCYGIPDVIVLDNGLEFLSRDLESVAFDLGIQLIFCPKREPWFKGRIERYLKTINYFFAHQLPGASFSRYYQRGDYDPQKHALMTLGEFKHIFEKWVLDVYAQSLHTGIATTPYTKWQEGATRREPALPGDVNVLNRRIGHVSERSLRRDGVQLDGIRYNSDAANQIARDYGVGVKVRVVSNSEDLGEIEIWGPDSQTPVSVPAVDLAYAKGLTKLQNECIQTQLREQGRVAVDAHALHAAKHELVQAVQTLMLSRKQRDRRRAAAIRGMSSNHPQADLLQIVNTAKVRRPNKLSTLASPTELMPSPAYASFQLRN